MKDKISGVFQEEFNWMQRESKGFYPWVQVNPWPLRRLIDQYWCHHCPWEHRREYLPSLVNTVLSTQVVQNPLLDIFFKALIRAEVRFISRFILQRSNEERLTGNLVSELDAAIFLARPLFKCESMERYGVEKEIDFYYHDLSRGGKVEKQTGADLAFITVVDLPDFPLTVRALVLQAKKCDGTAKMDLRQLQTLQARALEGAAYLFYDMGFRTLASPIVVSVENMNAETEEAMKRMNKSFALPLEVIFKQGVPLSLALIRDMIYKGLGTDYSSFESAFGFFLNLDPDPNSPDGFNGRLAIASIGKRISLSPNNDGGVHVGIQ